MAEELTKLEQLVEFILKVNEDTRRSVEIALKEFNEKRIAQSEDTLRKISDQEAEHAKRMKDGGFDTLTDLQNLQTQRLDKEAEVLQAIGEANERLYKQTIELKRKESEEVIKLAKTTAEERSKIEEGMQSGLEESAARRKEQKESTKTLKESQRSDSKPGWVTDAVGMAGLPTNLAQLFKSIVDGVRQGFKEGWSESGKIRDAQTTNAAFSASGMQAASNLGINESMRSAVMDMRMRVPEEYKDQVVPGMNAMMRGAPTLTTQMLESGENAGFNVINKALKDVSAVAVATGRNWAEAGQEITKLARDYGLSTGEAADTLIKITRTGQELVKQQYTALSGRETQIAVDVFSKNALAMAEKLKLYNVGVDEAIGLTARFAETLQKGTVSLEDLVNYVKGTAKQGPGTQAFIAAEIIQLARKDPETLGIQKALKGAEGDPMQLAYVYKGITEGSQQLAKEMGISTQTMAAYSKRLAELTNDVAAGVGSGVAGGVGSKVGARRFGEAAIRGIFGQGVQWSDQIDKTSMLAQQSVAGDESDKYRVDMNKIASETAGTKEQVSDLLWRNANLTDIAKGFVSKAGAWFESSLKNNRDLGAAGTGPRREYVAPGNELPGVRQTSPVVGGLRDVSADNKQTQSAMERLLKQSYDNIRSHLKEAKESGDNESAKTWELRRSQFEKQHPNISEPKVGPQSSLEVNHKIMLDGVSDFNQAFKGNLEKAVQETARSRAAAAREGAMGALQESIRVNNQGLG